MSTGLMHIRFLVILFLLASGVAHSQTPEVQFEGRVVDQNENPLNGVHLVFSPQNKGTYTNELGYFAINLGFSDPTMVKITYTGYEAKEVLVDLSVGSFLFVLLEDTVRLKEVDVTGIRPEEPRLEAGKYSIDPKTLELMPMPFDDFTNILTTLPGVVSRSEFSGAYTVRGGNFDENLVYVNDIPVYRPFLVGNGAQEGLSFVNPDMVSAIEFSAGGWQPKYGDKISSNLNVTYGEPEKFSATASLGLLGARLHAQGANREQSLSWSVGGRYKSGRYLLRTLEVQGQYFPDFFDVQSLITFTPGKMNGRGNDRTKISLLTAIAQNRYLVLPENSETEFGAFNQSFRLFVAFDGLEVMNYDTYQSALKISHQFNANFTSHLIISGVMASERENVNLEGGFRLCDLDKNIGSSTFNECATILGIGSNFKYARNRLDAVILNTESRNIIDLNDAHRIEFGLGFNLQQMDDRLVEYVFTDSADYVTDLEASYSFDEIMAREVTGYIQHGIVIGNNQKLTYGIRANYRDLNDQLLVSPRLQYAFRPAWKRDFVFRLATGWYSQPPFYREMRNFEGTLNPNLRGQQSFQVIAGIDQNLKIWSRLFKIMAEAYYKNLKDVAVYDVDNIRLRYYGLNNAVAYAAGVDFRFSGDFIPGAESWFSLGLLTTREDVEGDPRGFIRRPGDQRVNLSIYFQDHLPNDPTMRVNLSLHYSSGFPFGPPGALADRNVFVGGEYRRVDIGFTKILPLKIGDQGVLMIGAEILNLLGNNNVISYNWIRDVNNRRFAVPNRLSARFLNVKLTGKI